MIDIDMRFLTLRRKFPFFFQRKCLYTIVFIIVLFIILMIMEEEDDSSELCFDFSRRLYFEVLEKIRHFMISPLSLKVVLISLATTLQEDRFDRKLFHILCLGQSQNFRENFYKIHSELLEEDYLKFNVGNKLFVKDDLNLNTTFKNDTMENFKADLESIDFYSYEAVRKINKWIKENTKDRIKNVVMSINSNTSSILVNALYFHPQWNFKSKRLIRKRFRNGFHDSFETNVIAGNLNSFYYESSLLQAKFLKMPSKDDKFTTYIVLPNNIYGIELLELDIEQVLATKLHTTYDVYVEIPQFALETLIDYKPILENMGVHRIFENKSSAYKQHILKNYPLKLSAMLQNIFIEVDYVGVIGPVDDSEPARKQFIVNHPFIFYVEFLGEILFVGRFFPDLETKRESVRPY